MSRVRSSTRDSYWSERRKAVNEALNAAEGALEKV